MSKDDKNQNVSQRLIDMLVDSTLERHEINLETKKLDPKTKEDLRDMVKELQYSVNSLTKEKKED